MLQVVGDFGELLGRGQPEVGPLDSPTASDRHRLARLGSVCHQGVAGETEMKAVERIRRRPSLPPTQRWPRLRDQAQKPKPNATSSPSMVTTMAAQERRKELKEKIGMDREREDETSHPSFLC